MHHHLSLAQLIVLPQDFDFLEDLTTSSRRRRSVLTNSERDILPPAIFPVATSFLSPLATPEKDNEEINVLNSTTKSNQQHRFLNLITEKSDKPQSEIVETICLQNGACTCAELSCTVKCSSCARLTFGELCENINTPEGRKFVFHRMITN
uniref:Uncharacterized protein n=1 Tax=Meloidogyne enterolobii TaxID=390850 RepID=A0A6V7TTC8_MELEN|nr:unnamed protein product [Meloidogyne enterolobii]